MLPAAVPCPGRSRAWGTTSPSLVPAQLSLPMVKARWQPGDLGTCNDEEKQRLLPPLPGKAPASRQRVGAVPTGTEPCVGAVLALRLPTGQQATPKPWGDSSLRGPAWLGSGDPGSEPIRIPPSRSWPNSQQSWMPENTVPGRVFPSRECPGGEDPTGTLSRDPELGGQHVDTPRIGGGGGQQDR